MVIALRWFTATVLSLTVAVLILAAVLCRNSLLGPSAYSAGAPETRAELSRNPD